MRRKRKTITIEEAAQRALEGVTPGQLATVNRAARKHKVSQAVWDFSAAAYAYVTELEGPNFDYATLNALVHQMSAAATGLTYEERMALSGLRDY